MNPFPWTQMGFVLTATPPSSGNLPPTNPGMTPVPIPPEPGHTIPGLSDPNFPGLVRPVKPIKPPKFGPFEPAIPEVPPPNAVPYPKPYKPPYAPPGEFPYGWPPGIGPRPPLGPNPPKPPISSDPLWRDWPDQKPPRGPNSAIGAIGNALAGALALGGIIDGANETLNQVAHSCQNMLEDALGTGTTSSLSSILKALERGFENLQSQLVNLRKNCVGTKNVTQRPGHTKEECLLILRDAIRRLQAAIDRVREIRKALSKLRPDILAIADGNLCQSIADGNAAIVAYVAGIQSQFATIKAAYQDALNTYKEWLAAVEAIRRQCKCVDIPPEPLRAGINPGVFAYGGGLPSYL